MGTVTKLAGQVGGRSWAGVLLVLTVTGAVLLGLGVAGQTPAPPALAVAGSTVSTVAPASPAAAPVRPLPPARPTAVRLPSLGVEAPTLDLGLLPDRTLATPPDGKGIGWYTGSAAPGSAGPSVFAAHVTWDRKPGVFFRLAELKAGDRVEVAREDGRTAVFAIDRVASYSKEAFPTADVYDADLAYAGLRLITCAGEFDEATNRYPDNVVAYGSLVAVR